MKGSPKPKTGPTQPNRSDAHRAGQPRPAPAASKRLSTTQLKTGATRVAAQKQKVQPKPVKATRVTQPRPAPPTAKSQVAQKTQKAKWFKGSLNSAKAYAAVSFVDGMVGLATMANLFMPSPQPNMPSYNDIVQDFAAVQIQERNQEHIETARLMMRSAGKPKITRKK